jgi:hypothetical protein
MADQEWQFQEFVAPNGDGAAATFLNDPLRQGRGEASASLRENGTAGLLWLEPGSLGNATEPAWQVLEFPAPNGEKDVVEFLNAPPRQARGEATANLRENGTAGVIYLEPGSLGNSTAQTWQSADYYAPNSEQQAVDFLNAPARQGPGEASVTPRSNGATRLLWLEPGSLGDSAAPAWQYKNFHGPDGVQAALAFLNASPRQGAGEATGYVRNDGSALVFYLEPGSGS